MGTTNPQEKIDIDGGLKLGSAENANAGTIQWTGSDMQAHNGVSWKSLITPSELVDADGDTEILLKEGAQDEIKMRIDNKDILKTSIWADGSHYLDWFGDASSGAFEKIKHRFYINNTFVGSVGSSSAGTGLLELNGVDKVNIRGDSNSPNGAYLQIGDFFSTKGVGIAVGGYVSGGLRAMLDVRGDFECDGATINEVMNLAPMPEPASGSAGDLYMDDGSCGDCGGDVRLRFHNGSSWKTL